MRYTYRGFSKKIEVGNSGYPYKVGQKIETQTTQKNTETH